MCAFSVKPASLAVVGAGLCEGQTVNRSLSAAAFVGSSMTTLHLMYLLHEHATNTTRSVYSVSVLLLSL